MSPSSSEYVKTQHIDPQSPENRLIDRRQMWASNRFWMETENMKTKRYGNRSRHHWYELLIMMKIFECMLHVFGMYKTGISNAKKMVCREMTLYFNNLPKQFEDFSILHLSDLHLDGMEGLAENILKTINGRTIDICLLTGDYRTSLHGPHKHIIDALQYLINHIDSKQGFIGILGNHDSCHMVNPMEKIGIRMLINETCILHRNDEQIRIIGTDDVHYYYTDQALHAFEKADQDFTIALVHSSELFDMAAHMGVDLYLCGHTHAGQVCLPGGRAIIKHLNRGRKYYRGHWLYREMQGVTHAGVGTSGIPVRFNTQSEVLIYRLSRTSDGR
jgi:uncharacterized protein